MAKLDADFMALVLSCTDNTPEPVSIVDIESQVMTAMRLAGIEPPDRIEFDGGLHRFKSNSKGLDGWYCLFGDGVPAGTFGHWRDIPDGIPWQADIGRKLTNNELIRMRQNITKAKNEREQKNKELRAEAAQEAVKIWSESRICDSHPYLDKKQVACNQLKIKDDKLVIPITDGINIVSLQYIDEIGNKRFLSHGAIKGNYFVIGKPKSVAFLCEGIATAISINQETGYPVYIAFSASNIPSVASKIANQVKSLIVVADNDNSGIGLKYAYQAANETGCMVAEIPFSGMDANDYVNAGYSLKELLDQYMPTPWLVEANEFLKQPVFAEWLIDKWLQRNAMMMLFGHSGSGKTFVVLDWALHIATGQKKWGGCDIEQGAVVYLAGEGHIGLRGRIAAWATYHNTQPNNLWVSKDGCDIDQPQGIQHIIDNINDLPVSPVLIIVDTLHRFMSGDENKSLDARVVLNNCAKIMNEFNCSVILVHHTGTSDTAQHRARGSSAWRGALDVEIMVKSNNQDDPMTIQQTKSKDDVIQSPVLADLVGVDIPKWFDKKGKQISSAVLRITEIQTSQELIPAPTTQPSPTMDHPMGHRSKEFESAWWHGATEVVTVDNKKRPYLSKGELKEWVADSGKHSEAYINKLSKPSGPLISTLINANIIAPHKDGWIVIDPSLSSLLLIQKTE